MENAYNQKLAAKILKRAFKDDTAIWKNPVRGCMVTAFNPITKTIYKGRNAFLLSFAMFERNMNNDGGFVDPRFVTYKQMEEKGWRFKPEVIEKMKKGSMGPGYIVFYSDKFTPKKVRESEKYKTMSDDEKKAQERFFMKPYYVFNMADLDVPPMRKAVQNLLTFTEKERQTLYEQMIANSEAKVVYDAATFNRGINCYTMGTDTVHLVAKTLFRTVNTFYDTAAHEIAHSTGHPKRLNRKFGAVFGNATYAKEELVAELAATMLRIKYGGERAEDTAQHDAYLKSWFKDSVSDGSLVKVVADAAKAAEYIEEHMMFKDSKVPPMADKIKLLLTDGDTLGEGEAKKPTVKKPAKKPTVKKATRAKKTTTKKPAVKKVVEKSEKAVEEGNLFSA